MAVSNDDDDSVMVRMAAPFSAKENGSRASFLPPLRGFSILRPHPRLAPWATIFRCSAATGNHVAWLTIVMRSRDVQYREQSNARNSLQSARGESRSRG